MGPGQQESLMLLLVLASSLLNLEAVNSLEGLQGARRTLASMWLQTSDGGLRGEWREIRRTSGRG